jgi:hypothetical protein
VQVQAPALIPLQQGEVRRHGVTGALEMPERGLEVVDDEA